MSRTLSQPARFIVFALNVATFYILYVWATGHWSLTGGLETLWLGSAVAWWALSLLSAPFFRPPKDALGAGVAAFLALAATQLDPRSATFPYVSAIRNIGVGYALFVAAAALLAAIVERKQYERLARFSYLIAERLSSGPFLFGVVAFVSIFGAYTNFGTIFVLSLSWLFFALVRPFETAFSLADQWAAHSSDTAGKAIGQIIGVQSRHTYLAKLLAERVKIKRYDFVEFLDGADTDVSRKGFVVDNWVLNAEQWVKIVSGPDINKSLGRDRITPGMQPHIVYKITTEDTANILGRFVGTVAEGSNILAIKFDYGMKVPVSEGTLLEVPVSDQRVLYQITQGSTQTEVLENKNEAGLIIGQAAQIGTWNPETITFDRFGWVPEINTPVYLASEIAVVPAPPGEILIGHIPDTNYPIFMDKQAAVNCHMAILGVTGTGKSVFARDLIRRLSQDGMKFIAVDFTGEYKPKLAGLDPVEVVPPAVANNLFQTVDALAAEMAKFPNQRNVGQIAQWEQQLRNGFRAALLGFLGGDSHVAIFELPDVANSTSILSYTRWFFKVLFEIAKEGAHIPGQLCVVLEEAHTVVPEWSFVAADDKGAQALLNQIGQIALQGRKYGVGFMVIAQRTANVSKTVLTQCNTIIAFQQFDKTSSDFLANYMGSTMIDALQNLRPRQAIAVGKAFRSGLPTIFRVPDIDEPEPAAPPDDDVDALLG
jgi:uncharacterized protein